MGINPVPAAEAKIIITLKDGLVFIEGNIPRVDICRTMLCSAISAIEGEFLRQDRMLIKKPELKLS